MLTLLLIKFNTLTIRTRLIGGLSVGLIFVLLASWSFYKIFRYDDIVRYVSPNTRIYLHLDNRNAKDNFYRLKITDALLKPFNLNDLDRHLLGSELAVLCDDDSNGLSCGLIIQTKKIAEVRRYLADKKIFFRELKRDTIIVGFNGDWLKTIKKGFNPLRRHAYQGDWGRSGALTLVLNKPTALTDEISKTIYLAGINKPLKLNGATTNRGIIIRPESWGNTAFFGWKRIKKENYPNKTCDLLINSNRGFGSKTLNDHILRLFIDAGASATLNLTGRQFDACINKTNSTGNFVNDYDIIIQSADQLEAERIPTLEKILLNLASFSQPEVKTSYLTDGTRVNELMPRPDHLAFEPVGGAKTIKLNNGRVIFYSNTDDGLVISNKIGLNMPNNSQLPKNYLSIRINSMPESRIKDIISDFSYLTASDSQIVIK